MGVSLLVAGCVFGFDFDSLDGYALSLCREPSPTHSVAGQVRPNSNRHTPTQVQNTLSVLRQERKIMSDSNDRSNQGRYEAIMRELKRINLALVALD